MRNKFGAGFSKNKFHASKVVYQGIEFDSTYERDRYIYLMDLQKQGLISNLHLKSGFMLIQKTTKIVPIHLKTKTKFVERVVEQEAAYHNDFTYVENGKYICEEFKSVMTSKLPDYILRRKLMVKKIYLHNEKNHGQWVFREVVYHRKTKIIITDK